MVKEKWVSIKTWKGLYEVSNTGMVKRLNLITRNNIPMPEKLMNYEIVDGGYFRVTLTKRPRTQRYMVNRLVAIHFIPNPHNKPQVNHKDGNKRNNSVYNLEWSTSKENMQDAIRSGLKNNKINKRPSVEDKLVLKIFNSPLSLNKLSKKYDLPKLTIQSIKTGKRHSSVTGKIYLGRKY